MSFLENIKFPLNSILQSFSLNTEVKAVMEGFISCSLSWVVRILAFGQRNRFFRTLLLLFCSFFVVVALGLYY